MNQPHIVDAMGLPAGPQPQQGPINPMIAFYLPWFDRALNHYMMQAIEPEAAVGKARQFADMAFARLGFVFKAPFGFEVIPTEPPA